MVTSDPLDFGLDCDAVDYEEYGNKYYILDIKDQTDLMDGFRYIKELLLQYHNYKMYDDYTKLIDNDINVYSVKTDAFTINKNNLELAKQILKFSTDIGGWRLSKDNNIKLTPNDMKYINNKLIDIIEPKTTTIQLQDEWDVDEIADNLIKYEHVMIRADVPGAGKSYAAKHLQYRGYNKDKIVVCLSYQCTGSR